MSDSKAPIQAAYNEIRAYFSRPGAVLAKTPSSCLYRMVDEDGVVHACAVGCRLSDAWIEAHGGEEAVNECGSVYGLLDTYPDVAAIVGETTTLLLSFHNAAQQLHDLEAKDAADFVRLLDGLARKYALVVPT